MTFDYLARNNAFYATFWRGPYGARWPNADEVERAAPLLKFLAVLRERGAVAAERPRLLDVGCGRGWLTALLAAHGEAEGCEPTPEAVALARTLHPGVAFHEGTLGQLAARPGFSPYDVLVCSEVLEHVPRGEKGAFVDELAAGVRPGGHCLVTTPRGEVWDLAGDTSDQMIEEWVTERELERLFVARGFAPLLHERSYPTRASLPDRLLGRVRRLLGAPAARDPLGHVQRALDHHFALYQAWCFRRA